MQLQGKHRSARIPIRARSAIGARLHLNARRLTRILTRELWQQDTRIAGERCEIAEGDGGPAIARYALRDARSLLEAAIRLRAQ